MTAGETKPAPAGLTPAELGTAGELFEELFGQLQAIGRAPDGSSTRLAWTEETARAEAWFDDTAQRLGLTPSVDRNGNRWAWAPGGGEVAGIVTGSHLDTVPRGGSFDGALGVVCGLIATSLLLKRGGPGRPLGVVAFADEEGGRFNTPTFGSRLLVGSLKVKDVLERADGQGITLSRALQGAGLRPDEMGRDEEVLRRVGAFVELHIEQGRLLEDHGQPIGIATAIIPHGRWRIDLAGEGNHGGTTAMSARRDPMVALAEVLQASRRVAEEEGALVTVGKLDVWPNAPTSIAERVSAWLDVRSEQDEALDRIVGEIGMAVGAIAASQGVQVQIESESRTAEVRFAPELAEQIGLALNRAGLRPVPMSTGAGHDAGVLAAELPTAMLFVRNESGISHSPAELAEVEDCLSGIGALVTALDELRTGDGPVPGSHDGKAVRA